MKLIITAVSFLLATTFLSSGPIPEHYNNWIFGENAGITFTTNDGNPEPFKAPGDYFFLHGAPSISNDNGEFLYYLYLPNTSGLNDSFIRSESGIVSNSEDILVDIPYNMGLFIQSYANENQYHLLTNYTADTESQKGFYYNLVDRDKNGEVVVKNRLLFPNTTQKMTAVVNEVDNICWVLAHEINNNTFRIIKIDENGLDENVITQNIGLNHLSSSDLIGAGRMDVSPNGTTIAVTIPYYDPDNTGEYESVVELFRFDPKTGILSDPVQIFLDEKSFSATFSPNGKILYVRVKSKIYQYDLTICDVEDMVESKYVIETKNTPSNPTMERGPNGLIYSTGIWESALDAILNPNEVGAASNYTRDVVEVEGDALRGLPTVINSYFTGEYDDYCFIKEDMERSYIINAPKNACFGDDIFLQIESENGDDFEAEMIRSQYISNYVREPVGPNFSTNGIVDFNFKIESEFSTWPRFNFRFRIVTENGDVDTVSIPIESANCCTPFIRNWRFNEWNTSNTCYPVGYMTDYFFSPDSNVSCVAEIKRPGELKSSSSANRNLDNFDKTPTIGRLIVGDPLPNVEQRAWYQNYATKIGTRYRFMASVCNVEKIERSCEPKADCGRSLDMWIGIKNRNQELVLNRVDDIKYEDDWILLSGEFTAQDNYSEFQVWTLGNTEDDISYGFAIDFVDLELVEEYEFIIAEDTTICIADEYSPNNQFNGNIVDVNWEPTNGVSDPDVLNPVVSPSVSTKYTITLFDELGCEYVDSLFVEVDSCLPVCIPCVSYTMNDRVVNLGHDYCLEGEFTPVCSDSSRKKDISLYFEYDPSLMRLNSTSSDSEELLIDDRNVIKLSIDESEYELDKPNKFELCFTALLGSDSLTSLKVFENSITQQETCVDIKDSSTIKYEACVLPYRSVVFLTATEFFVEELENKIVISLSTEEQGNFRFVISDVNGSSVEEFNYTNNNGRITKAEVYNYSTNELAAGVYFIRMQSPSGKVRSIKFVKE
jgi:hypothetical protein